MEQEKFKDQVRFIPVASVWGVGEYGLEARFREDMGDITELTNSIKEKGVLQPITVAHARKNEVGTDHYPLMAGRRRLWAAINAGLTEIPALIRHIDGEIDLREIELIENLARKDFTFQEQAKLVKRIDSLYREKNTDWNQRKTASILNMGLGSVSRALQLANAVEMVPEIAQAKDQATALKMIDRLEEQVTVETLIRGQDTKALDKGIKAMLDMAKRDYRIGDTIKELKKLKTNGDIHIIECDPPYGIDLNEQKRGKEEVGATIVGYNEVNGDKYAPFLTELANELYRVAAKDSWLVFWFGPTWFTEVKAALKVAGWQVDDIPAIWVKPQGQTNSPQTYLGRSYEPFFMCRKGKPFLKKQGRLNTFLYTGAQHKYHPTQRPTELIKDILETLGVEMMTVLVPFLGSGATLRAAYLSGMKAFGWDISDQYRGEFLLAIEEDARQLNKED